MDAKRVLVFGTFDGLHSGHEFFLRKAKARGVFLTVGVARDSHVTDLKGKRPQIIESRRRDEIEKLGFVDKAVLCDEILGSYQIVIDENPDIIVLGHDQKDLEKDLIRWMAKSDHYIPMIRIKKI